MFIYFRFSQPLQKAWLSHLTNISSDLDVLRSLWIHLFLGMPHSDSSSVAVKNVSPLYSQMPSSVSKKKGKIVYSLRSGRYIYRIRYTGIPLYTRSDWRCMHVICRVTSRVNIPFTLLYQKWRNYMCIQYCVGILWFCNVPIDLWSRLFNDVPRLDTFTMSS